ncbi:MAG: hypothetical protein KGJ80_17515 [Chloroflexota bacterium]|nr:hypothetical protein [Chloroflexota bacterium]
MDARGVQRLLEKTQGMAETAEHVGMRNAEMMQREPHLSAAAKAKLARLYREHALRVMKLYATLGLEICDTVRDELDDDPARGQLDLFRANFVSLTERAAASLREPDESAESG